MTNDVVDVMRHRQLTKAAEITTRLEKKIDDDITGTKYTIERYHEWLDILELKYIIESLVKLEES